jgi:hypothetical protein
MAELKTKENDESVEDFLLAVENESARADCRELVEMMSRATNSAPKMWGPSIVGFGRRRVKYSTGREIDWLVVGFSPRKQNLSLYLSTGEAWNEELLGRLGKHKTGMGCLYVKRLSDVDRNALLELIGEAVAQAGD